MKVILMMRIRRSLAGDWKADSRRAWHGPDQLGYVYLGGGFKYFLFSPLFGEDSHFD